MFNIKLVVSYEKYLLLSFELLVYHFYCSYCVLVVGEPVTSKYCDSYSNK